MSLADMVVLSIIFTACALIVRGMLRGSIKACDEGSCGGNCASCGGTCAAPRIRLSAEQRRQLRALDERGPQA